MPPSKLLEVRDVMTVKLITIPPESTLAEALSTMERNGIHELPVMTNSTLKGWISYHGIVRHHGLPPQTKVTNVMEQPPRLQKDADLVEAAELMIHNNVRALPVVDGKGKVVGILSRTDILKAALEIKELANLGVDQVMNTELETVSEDEHVDHSVQRLRDLHISQFLVLDGEGKLAGHVALEDLMRAQSAGHSPAGTEHQRGGSFRGGERKSRVDVKGFIKAAPTVAPGSKVADAIRLMTEHQSNFVAVVEDGFALGVVSRSNIVERVARLRPQSGVLCQIVGLAGGVDSATLDSIYTLAQHSLKKIAAEVKTEFLSLHYKVYKAKDEGDRKYALSLHLSTEQNFLVQKADAWDPIEATKVALDGMEKRVLNIKDLRLERRKGPPRRKAQFYEAARPR